MFCRFMAVTASEVVVAGTADGRRRIPVAACKDMNC
jgi:hypothetical protein